MTRRTALITGASNGIGAGCARLLAANGFDIAVAYNSDLTGAEAVAKDVSDLGGHAVLIQADVGSPTDVDRMFQECDAAFPRLDALINNAGIVAKKSTIAEMDPDRIAQIMAVNVTGAFLVVRNAVRRMLATGSGAIVNVSSAAAKHASANQYVDYAASKGAIDVMTKGLAEEVAASGIRVNAVRPGIIETDIHAKGGEPDRASLLGPTVPMQRAGSVDEVAKAILWLLSDEASYVTGSILDVSGGR